MSQKKEPRTGINTTPVVIKASSERVTGTGTDAAPLVAGRQCCTIRASDDATRNGEGVGTGAGKGAPRIRMNSSLVICVVMDTLDDIDLTTRRPVWS